MKKSLILSLFLFAFSFAFAERSIKVIDKFFTSENLNLRSAPSTDAKKIVTIPKHTVVFVIQEGPSEKIDGKTAKWKKVVCDKFENNGTYKAGITDWVFSEYLSDEDSFTDQEIEKILLNNHFDNSYDSMEIYGFSFSIDENNVKRITAVRDSLGLPGCFESTSSVFHVKDGKIFLDKPFEVNKDNGLSFANSCFYDEDGNSGYMTLRRENSTEGEYCLCCSNDFFGSELKSKPSECSLILDYDILLSTETVSFVLPSDCVFYDEPNHYTISFPSCIDIKSEGCSVLVYNLDRVFKGQKVASSKWYVNEEEVNGVKGRWYCLGEFYTADYKPVWIFVPSTVNPNAKEIPLTVKTFLDAQKKGFINCRVLSKEDIELISNTHHHMNPWIDSCLDTFPWGKK